MRLTQFTDYSLRVLIYLALHADKDELITIDQLAETYGASRHHIRSVVHHLAKLNYIKSTQGKGGGLALAQLPEDISVREVIQVCENDFFIVDCFNPEGNNCPIEPICVLKNILSDATKSFLHTLDNYTLQDLLKNKKKDLNKLLPAN